MPKLPLFFLFSIIPFSLEANHIFSNNSRHYYMRVDIGYIPNLKIGKDYKAEEGEKVSLGQTGFGGIGIGIHTPYNTRLELTAYHIPKMEYRSTIPSLLTNAHMSVTSSYAMINGYYSPPIHKVMQPYIMGGIGYAANKTGTTYTIRSDTNTIDTLQGQKKYSPAFHIGAGVGFEMRPGTVIDLSYRYAMLGTIKRGGNNSYLNEEGDVVHTIEEFSKGRLTAHQIMIGLRYYF